MALTMSKIHVRSLTAIVLALAATGCGGGSSGEEPDASFAVALNDTGRDTCSGDTAETAQVPCPVGSAPGQDGEFGRDAQAKAGTLIKMGGGSAGFDFTKLGSDGVPLLIQDQLWDAAGSEAEGSYWSCVVDHTTQLTWEVKHTQLDHPRYGLNTYSWYASDAAQNGGFAGTSGAGNCTTQRCDSEGYVEYMNSIALCGHSDWRMPSVSEFYSIAHKGREDPAIDTHYFPNMLGALRYWTANTVAELPQIAWYIYFSDASISYTGKDNKSYLRLVRSEPERGN